MTFYALIEYEDKYVQPLILSALDSQLPTSSYRLITSISECPPNAPLLQIRPYELIDFDRGFSASGSLFNAYIIRKALIRKHYLSNTIASWATKYPDSNLHYHYKQTVDFELDYAEFLEDALLEAYELNDALMSNTGKLAHEREWWILKPGMSDGGNGIRLFSSKVELREIFKAWEEQYSDSDVEDAATADNDDSVLDGDKANGLLDDDHIMTSHLRHFVAQPYIHPPLLLSSPPFNKRKFHIRTYVVAAGALRIYVYTNMLALFASEPYAPPWETATSIADDTTIQHGNAPDASDALRRLRNVHLTNTCVQTTSTAYKDTTCGTTPSLNAVHLFSDLPLTAAEFASINSQIHCTTASVFRAALAHPTNFQPLPQSFEIFGLDFLVSSTDTASTVSSAADRLTVWLLEVNAFPDFAQTGEHLREVVVKGLFEEVMAVVVRPYFGITAVGTDESSERAERPSRFIKVLDIDLKRM